MDPAGKNIHTSPTVLFISIQGQELTTFLQSATSTKLGNIFKTNRQELQCKFMSVGLYTSQKGRKRKRRESCIEIDIDKYRWMEREKRKMKRFPDRERKRERDEQTYR